MDEQAIRILLVEDDEDDYVLFEEAVTAITNQAVSLTWVDTREAAKSVIRTTAFDMLFVDYRLNGCTGLELLHDLQDMGYVLPFVLLTGHGEYDVDLQAMENGASDYLEKDLLSPQLIERVIRYALSRAKTLDTLKRSRKQLRMLSEKLLHAQEKERSRIARELHDSTSSKLTAIKYAIEKQLYSWDADGKKPDRDALRHVVDLIKEAGQDVQRIYADLRPTVIDDLGILAAVRRLCRHFETLYDSIEIQTELAVQEADIPENIKIVIYRVIQEAFNNIAKHSRATQAILRLTGLPERNGSGIRLVISDDGQGFNVDAAFEDETESLTSGFGLISMRERVVFSGGAFSVESSGKEGTTLNISWPFEEHDA